MNGCNTHIITVYVYEISDVIYVHCAWNKVLSNLSATSRILTLQDYSKFCNENSVCLAITSLCQATDAGVILLTRFP